MTPEAFKLFKDYFQEGISMMDDYEERTTATPNIPGSTFIHELDIEIFNKMFEALKDNPDGRAALAVMINYTYNWSKWS